MRKDLPRWKTNIDEISNGVFKVTLTDADGRKAEIIDNATDETIDKAIEFPNSRAFVKRPQAPGSVPEKRDGQILYSPWLVFMLWFGVSPFPRLHFVYLI